MKQRTPTGSSGRVVVVSVKMSDDIKQRLDIYIASQRPKPFIQDVVAKALEDYLKKKGEGARTLRRGTAARGQ